MNTMTQYPRVIFTPDYTITYEGGRLADVKIGNRTIETVQVRDYEWETGTFGQEPDDRSIRSDVAEFIAEAGGIEVYQDNL